MRNDIKSRLRDADPVPREAALSPEAVAAMRRTVVAAADRAAVRPLLWGRQLAIAAGLAAMTLTGLVTAHRVPSVRDARDVAPSKTPPGSGQRTQVQFSTPGGTRIVWTLDPGFQLTETR